ncbi:MAG TPA: NADH-quinone oxidoreductase subunit M [Isosphaeraceae bacterium]|jgi:NADH-quinone oxidoreductase subunit M|nr:NADH-quinone oxidoreductase subunit M [Isosphaeraceae bacterium]
MSDDYLLSLLWFLPLVGCLVVLLLPRRSDLVVKYTALGFTAATFLLTLVAFGRYVEPNSTGTAPLRVSLRDRAAANPTPLDTNSQPRGAKDAPPAPDDDLVVRDEWIPAFHIQYFLGLDGISLSLVVLTGLVSLLACLASWNIEKQVRGYFSLFLLLLASMMGVFMALDLFLFYVFFEVMLLPMYFLIGIWGGENREYAAIKFLLYTLFGSVFILVAILILYFWPGTSGAVILADNTAFRAHTFDALRLTQAASETNYYGNVVQQWVFLLFFTGFCVKLPSFPFHTWLPDAHVQAPTPISMILAGVLLKIGGYGLIRLAWPLAPLGAMEWAYPVAILGVVSILYGALAAMAQTDFKKLVAYSSVSHMGYVTLGMAAMNLIDPRAYEFGVAGAMFMMIAHGITSTGMFFLVGVIYDRAHTRDLKKLGGLWNVMPVYGAVSFLIFFGSMGLPGLCGFVAEVFVVLAAFGYQYEQNVFPVLAICAAAAVILTAGYILWTLQRVFLGRSEQYRGLPDMTPRENLIAAPLVLLTVLLGVLPTPMLLGWMGPSVHDMVTDVNAAGKFRTGPLSNADAPATPPPAFKVAGRR